MTLKSNWFLSPDSALRHWLNRATEPVILFPAIAIVLLGVIWGASLNLIRVEHVSAGRAAAVSGRELGETYEAQVVRALREIDQTLKVVQYAFERQGSLSVLQELKDKGLLPSALLFVISIVDVHGDVVASSRPFLPTNVADNDFQSQRQVDALRIGRPPRGADGISGKLRFSRRLNAADGQFAGIVTVTVDSAYFVSGYDPARLGQQGVLAIIGTDGVFRARRTGDSVSAGDTFDYASVVPANNNADSEATLSTNVWDGVQRYTTLRPLFDFPLTVIVGLSAQEQLTVARQDERGHLWRASAASLLLITVLTLLGRLSHQLTSARTRAANEQIAHAARVEYLAYHDGLTTLPNRSLFSKLLGQSITQAHRYKRQLAVLFLDLDRFKHINDTLGHEAGDQLLQEVATRLKACLRDSDSVARLGGDEFVALLPQLDEEKYVATVAQKILSAIARPFPLRGVEFRITASIGIATYPQDGLDEQTLTKNADIAMYQAKGEGKNNFQFFSEKLNANSLERLTLESGLRHAQERNELALHYQVKRDIHSGHVTGVEALLRWQHPDLGTVAPMHFIPVAEETGLIVPIGKWVLRTACLQNVAWQGQGLPRMSIAVNLTARQFFDEHLLVDLKGILAATGMDAQLLELEIAESLLMRDVKRTLRILTDLKNMGVRIAIDDFGIGYSSLATLQQFPLDTIKIDRSFIRDITSEAEDKNLTEAIIAMGRTLSLTVVAQGVETKEQADYLRSNACDEFQGFYLNKPVTSDQIANMLQAELDREGSGHQALL